MNRFEMGDRKRELSDRRLYTRSSDNAKASHCHCHCHCMALADKRSRYPPYLRCQSAGMAVVSTKDGPADDIVNATVTVGEQNKLMHGRMGV